MACNPTRLELSNAAATTVTITLTSDPGDGTTVTLEVDGLGIDTSSTTSGGSASFTIAAVSAANNSLWDATIQVGSNRPATASVLVTETNTTQAIGVTIDDSSVTYCAPTGGGGGTGGTGDASTANPISQFSDVSYTSPRDADILSRAAASTWTAQRPEYLWVDRRPMMVAHYGATDSQPQNFGVATSSHRLTPVSGSADHTSTSLNGRIDFLFDRFVTPQSANTEKIKRYVVGTPSGYVGGPTHDSYPSTAGYIIANDPDDAKTYNSDGTVASTFDTPFTDDGTTTGNKGDQQEAWTAALTWFRNELSDFVLELTAYIGYFVIFEPDASGNPTTTYKTDINGYDNDWNWSVKPTVADVDGFFGPQWTTFEAIGFDTMGFDLGTNVWSDTGTSGRALIDEFIDLAGERVMFEAVPRTSEGQQLDDIRAYRNARYWFYFPALAEIDGVNASSPSSTRIRVDDWNLDPSCTEVHVVFDWFQCANASQLNMSGTRIRELMDIAHERGFVVSTTGGASPAAASDGWTVAEFHQYAIDLWKRTRGLVAEAAVSSVNGAAGAVVLTGEDIDTTPTSGTTVKSAIDTVNTIAVGNALAIAQLDLDALTDVNAPTPADGEVLQFDQTTGKWIPAGVGGTGTVTSVDVAGGTALTSSGGPVTSSGTITMNLDDTAVTPGSYTLASVTVDQQGRLTSAASGTLPAVQDSYLMLIESPSDKTYTLDARVAADRTVTAFYAKTASGTCTATLENLTDATTIGTISVTSTGGSAASLTNTGLTATDRIAIEITSSSSPADLEIVVEYTQ